MPSKKYQLHMTPATKFQLDLIKYGTFGYLLFFTVYYVLKGNYEFLLYGSYLLLGAWYIRWHFRDFYFGRTSLVLISLFFLLHLMAGFFYIGDTRLYDYWFIEGILKFDNFVHTLGGALAGFVSYNFLSFHLDARARQNLVVVTFIVLTMSSGFGAYNEIIESIAVFFFDAAEAVGGYTNTVLDLIYNLVGAAGAAVAICIYKKLSPPVDE